MGLDKSNENNSTAELKKLWKYGKRTDGTIEILEYKGGMPEVTVPSKIGKFPVTHIASPDYGKSVFPYFVKKVNLPEGLISIGARVFLVFGSSIEVNIPESVMLFEEDTFAMNYYPDNIDLRYEKIGAFYRGLPNRKNTTGGE